MSRAETSERLPDGDEYVDLEHVEQGVRFSTESVPIGRALPKTAVDAETWHKILTHLRAASPHSR